MKVIGFVVFAFVVFNCNADVPSDVSDVLRKIWDRIPEPLAERHDRHFELDYAVEKITVDVKDLQIKGVKNMYIETMDYDEFSGRLDYVLDFQAVGANVDFILNLSGLVAFENNPTMRVDLTDLKISGYAVVDSSADPVQITDFSVFATIDGAKFELSNILNDADLTESISNMWNENFLGAFNTLFKDLEPVLSPVVQSIFNIFLRYV